LGYPAFLLSITHIEIWAKALYEYFAGEESPLTGWGEDELSRAVDSAEPLDEGLLITKIEYFK